MSSVLPLHTIDFDESKVQLVDDSRRLQRMAGALALHVVAGQTPLFVVDERLLDGRWRSPNRLWFLRGSVKALAEELASLGAPLTVVRGDPRDVVPAFAGAVGAQRVLGADVGIAATGVAGPDEQDGQVPGTVWFAIALPGRTPEAFTTRLPGDRERVRQFSAISLLNALRQRLESLP
jgi:hypothetical protein